MPSLVHTEDGRSPRVRGPPATMTDGPGKSKLPEKLRELRIDPVTGVLHVGPDYFPHNSLGMYDEEDYARKTRGTFSYWNQHVKNGAGERAHGTMADRGDDPEGNKHYFDFLLDKRTGLLGGRLISALQAKLIEVVVDFQERETDPDEKLKWSFDGTFPKNLQDVCDIIKTARFQQTLRTDPDRAASFIITYINYPASRGCTRKWVQECVNEYLSKHQCKVVLDMCGVTNKKCLEHGLYRLAKNEAMQKYAGSVRNTLQRNHKVKLDLRAKVGKDGTLPKSQVGHYVRVCIREHAPSEVVTAMGGTCDGEFLLLRLHDERTNPKSIAAEKMTDLMGEMGRNGLRDQEILDVVNRGYAIQAKTSVGKCPFVMADNSQDALRRELGGDRETSDGNEARDQVNHSIPPLGTEMRVEEEHAVAQYSVGEKRAEDGAAEDAAATEAARKEREQGEAAEAAEAAAGAAKRREEVEAGKRQEEAKEAAAAVAKRREEVKGGKREEEAKEAAAATAPTANQKRENPVEVWVNSENKRSKVDKGKAKTNQDRLETNARRVHGWELRTMIDEADPVDCACLPNSRDVGWCLVHCMKATNNDYPCTLAVCKSCMKVVEERGKDLTGRRGRRGRGAKNNYDKRGDACGQHTLEFLLTRQKAIDKWILWPNMTESKRKGKNKDNNPIHCWVCGGRLE